MNNDEMKFFAEVVEVVADNRDEVDCGRIDPTRMLEIADKLNMTGLLHVLQSTKKLVHLQPAYAKILQDKYVIMHEVYTKAMAKADAFFRKLKQAGIPFLLTGETAVHKMLYLYGCFHKDHFEILIPQEYLAKAKLLLEGAPVTIDSKLTHIDTDIKYAGSLRGDNCVEAILLCMDLCKGAPPEPSFKLLTQIYFIFEYGKFNYSVFYQMAHCKNALQECRRVFRLMATVFPTVKLSNLFMDFIG